MGKHRTRDHLGHRRAGGDRGRRNVAPLALALAGVLAGCLLLAAPVIARPQRVPSRGFVARAATLSLTNGYVSQLACGSASQCTGVLPGGAALTFNPTRAGSVTRTQPISHSQEDGTLAIECPSTSSCVEADAAGHVAVFAPRRATAKAKSFTMTGEQYQTTISCPSRSECVTETYTGVSVFDPARLGSPKTVAITANGDGGQPTISCPSTSLCAGSDGTDGHLYNYAPHDAAGAKVHTLTSTPQVGSVDCTSRSFCVALASPKADPAANTGFITFNPTGPGNPGVKKLTGSTLEFLTCASATLCAAAGNNGGVLTFDPRRPGHSHLTAVPTGNDVAGIAFAGRSLVLITLNGEKAVFDPSAPPKTVRLSGLSKAASVSRAG
jgi:hypothetical protein